MGMLVLLGVHALSAITITHAEICVYHDPDNVGCNVVEGIFGTGGQLFSGDWLVPLMIWGLLGFSHKEIAAQHTHLEKGGGSYASV